MEKPDGFVEVERIQIASEDLIELRAKWQIYEDARLSFNRASLVVAAKFKPSHDRYVHIEDECAVISVPGGREFQRDAKNLGMLTGGGAGR